MEQRIPTVSGTTNLLDILDRILDKGLVVAGDIRVSLANVELLTVRIRLLVCSVDKAEQIGLDWWRFDPNLSAGAAGESRRLSAEAKVSAGTRTGETRPKRVSRKKSKK